AACKHEALCALCGTPHHGDSESPCSNPKSCVNCKGEHAAFDKACPRWQIETAIMKAKTDGNISFQEARKIVEAKSTLPTPGITYAAMANRSTKSISTQTEIVNCTCHCRVDIMQT